MPLHLPSALSCTAICPVMSGTLAQVQQELGADAARLRMVSISIALEHDMAQAEWVRLDGLATGADLVKEVRPLVGS